MGSGNQNGTKITTKLTSAAFLDDIKIKAVGLPAIAGVSLAWRVRVTASSDPLFCAQIFPGSGKYCAWGLIPCGSPVGRFVAKMPKKIFVILQMDLSHLTNYASVKKTMAENLIVPFIAIITNVPLIRLFGVHFVAVRRFWRLGKEVERDIRIIIRSGDGRRQRVRCGVVR